VFINVNQKTAYGPQSDYITQANRKYKHQKVFYKYNLVFQVQSWNDYIFRNDFCDDVGTTSKALRHEYVTSLILKSYA